MMSKPELLIGLNPDLAERKRIVPLWLIWLFSRVERTSADVQMPNLDHQLC